MHHMHSMFFNVHILYKAHLQLLFHELVNLQQYLSVRNVFFTFKIVLLSSLIKLAQESRHSRSRDTPVRTSTTYHLMRMRIRTTIYTKSRQKKNRNQYYFCLKYLGLCWTVFYRTNAV